MRTRMRFSALALFAALCLSHAAFALDFSPWQLKGRFIVPGNYAMLDNGDVTAQTWSDRDGGGDFHYLTWWHEGNILREIPLSWDENRHYLLIPRSGGACAALSWEQSLEPQQDGTSRVYRRNIILSRWDDAGLTEEKAFPGNFLSVISMNGGFALGEGADAGLTLHAYDASGEALDDMILPAGSLPAGLKKDGPGSYWALSRDTDGGYSVRRFAGKKEGWSRSFPQSPAFFPDHRGGVYRCERLGSDATVYKPVEITHYDAEGRLLARRVLSSDRLVLSAAVRPDDETDGVLVYGMAVAHSRRQYHVYLLTLNSRMEQTALSVRTIDYYRDYAPQPVYTENGLYVFAGGGETAGNDVPCALVPFDALPQADARLVSLR